MNDVQSLQLLHGVAFELEQFRVTNAVTSVRSSSISWALREHRFRILWLAGSVAIVLCTLFGLLIIGVHAREIGFWTLVHFRTSHEAHLL